MKKHQNAAMTRKEALAALHKLYEAVGGYLYHERASEEDKVLRDQVVTALCVLGVALHGEPPTGKTSSLCDVCYLRYVPLDHPWVYLKGNPTESPKYNVCSVCMARLKAEGKIDHFRNWETGEVTLC